MENIKINETPTKLTIDIDLTKNLGLSKSGKTIMIATTSGNARLACGASIGINCYKPKQ